MKTIEKLVKRLFWVPFVLGMVGYWIVLGLPFLDSVYATSALYFINPAEDVTNAWVLASKLLAMFVTTSFILNVLGNVWDRAKHFIWNQRKDSACIYGDNESCAKLAETMSHGYYCRDISEAGGFGAHDHIFYFTDEEKGLRCFWNHQKELEGKRVFIGLQKLDPFLMRETQGRDIHFFSIPELTARLYWKANNLCHELLNEKKELNIAILKYDPVGQAIFKYGYMNNLYSLSQKVTYHIWGCTSEQKTFLRNLDTENSDQIVTYDADWTDQIEEIGKMDRVIVTQEMPLEIIETLLYENPLLPIHYYSATPVGYEKLINARNLVEFGNLDDILTDENVRQEKLYRQAKLFNYDYELRSSGRTCPEQYEEEMEASWRQLNGFKKGSCMARADHYWIETVMKQNGAKEEELWEIEHMRWCRFHKINHWKYAKQRDNEKRLHHLLIPYHELSEREKEKDGIYDATMKREIDRLIG
ncbi:MAG: hypothetical protein IJI38_09290 [Clostridia bacterium]|nr:hypothetical protein [Clostridia bacterium]